MQEDELRHLALNNAPLPIQKSHSGETQAQEVAKTLPPSKIYEHGILNKTENLQLKNWSSCTSTDKICENKIKRSESYKNKQGLSGTVDLRLANLTQKITQQSPYDQKLANYFSEKIKINFEQKAGNPYKQADSSNTLTDADTNYTDKLSLINNSKFKRSTTSSTLSIQSNSS